MESHISSARQAGAAMSRSARAHFSTPFVPCLSPVLYDFTYNGSAAIGV